MLTLTLADVRLAALRVVLGATPLVIVLLVVGAGGAPGRTVSAAVAFAAWGLGPVALVERAASRRGLGPLGVGLAAGAASAVCLSVALAQALVIGRGLDAGWLAGRRVDLDDLVLCALLGACAAVPVAGATFVHVMPSVHGRPVSSSLARWLVEPLLSIAAVVGGIPLLCIYACSDGLEELLVGTRPARARRLEALPGSPAPTDDP